MTRCLPLLTLFLWTLAPLAPAQPPSIAGSFEGALKLPTGQSLRLRLHIDRAPDGTLKATFDSVDQGVLGMPIDEITFANGTLRWSLERISATYEGKLAASGNAIDGTIIQGSPMPLAFKRMDRAALGQTPARPQEPRPPFPYASTDVTMPSKAAGVTLAGTLTVPSTPGPHPAIVLITGSGPQDRDETIAGHKPFLVLADHLTRRGIAVLRFDDRGVGKSTGSFTAATTPDFAHDAEGALGFLLTRPEIDAKRLGVLGHSEGALAALMIAARRAEVSFLVFLAGTAVPGADVILAQTEAIARAMGAPEAALAQNRDLQKRLLDAARSTPSPLELRKKAEEILAAVPEPQRNAQVNQLLTPWMRFFINFDPAPVIRRIKCPVLALFGELDLQVLSAQNSPVMEQALREAGNPRTEIHRLAKLNHLFQPATTGTPQEYGAIETTIDPKALDLVTAWLRRNAGLEPNP